MGERATRNWPAIGGLLLGLAGVVGYFGLVLWHDPRLSGYIHTPFLNLLLIAAGIVLSAVGVIQAWRRTRRGRFVAPALAVLNLGLSGFLLSHLFIDSYRLPDAARAPAVGSVAPDFELKNTRGEAVNLSSYRGRSLVLVFYRGFW